MERPRTQTALRVNLGEHSEEGVLGRAAGESTEEVLPCQILGIMPTSVCLTAEGKGGSAVHKEAGSSLKVRKINTAGT